MNQKILHYAYLFVKEELQQIEQSITNESDSNIKQHLINRKTELEIDMNEIQQELE